MQIHKINNTNLVFKVAKLGKSRYFEQTEIPRKSEKLFI